MSYLVSSRIIYSLPFLIYAVLNFKNLVEIPSLYPLIGMWLAIFLFSMFFFCLAKRILPLLLVHFVFFAEMFLFTMMAMDSGQYSFFFFIILSSFYTIESLRNNSLNMFVHVLGLFGGLYYIHMLYGVSLNDMTMNITNLCLIASPIVCRAIMSSIEERDVVLREKVQEKNIYIPTADSEETDKLTRKMNFFKEQTKTLKNRVADVEKDNEKLQRNYQRTLSEFEKLYNSNQNNQKINKDIAESYFKILANLRFNLNKTLSENIKNTLECFMNITKSQYVALIILDKDDEGNDSGEVSLIDSCQSPNLKFDDSQILESVSVSEYILETIENNKTQFQTSENFIDNLAPIKSLIYTPVSYTPVGGKADKKGVLIQAFDENFNNNIHNFNLSLMVAYHIYMILENENLYKQAKDEAYIDGLTKAFNKKYLLNNLQTIFNNTYNYGSNLACVFVDIDYFKQVNDQHGHDIGDNTITKIASILKENIRKSDFLIRFGGDEFIVLLNSVTTEKLKDFAEKVNSRLAEYPLTIIVDEKERKLSASMGAKIYYPLKDNIKDANHLLKLADEAVYIAKQKGKGQIYILE